MERTNRRAYVTKNGGADDTKIQKKFKIVFFFFIYQCFF